MMITCIVLLVLMGPIGLRSQPAPPSDGPSCTIPAFRFDGYLLTLQWPIAFCYKQGACALERPRHQWIIHGLWPQFNASKAEVASQLSGSPFPQYCCHPQNQIDLAQLDRRLSQEMVRVWPSLKQPRRSPQSEMFSFWRHEWTKHGTCALDPKSRSPFSVQDYFDTTLQLYRQFQLDRWLSAGRITPSNDKTYSRANFHQALEATNESELQGAFRLNCDRPPQSSPRSPGILSEIQICLDPTFNPINCAHLFGPGRDELTSGMSDDHQCGHEVVLLEL